MKSYLGKFATLLANIACVAGLFWPLGTFALNGLPIPATLFSLSHPVGQQRLVDSDYRQAFWSLASYFETQKNQAYCSVASSVIALNALGVPRPQTPQYPDYPFFMQDSFFDRVSPEHAVADKVAYEGMTLSQLAKVLTSFEVKVEAIHAGEISLEVFRQVLKSNLRDDDRVVLLNFNRKLLDQAGGGHWSPLAAYHEKSDSVLVMDVARFKYPPLWVPVTELYNAALNVDSVSGKSRGLIVISRP